MNGMLYHISDRPDIERFVPRPAPSKNSGQTGNMVWAVDYVHLHNYLLPRECPRVTFYALPTSDHYDIERLMGCSTAKYVIAIETGWLPKVREEYLYQYEFLSDAFVLVDQGAGYYISREAVVPHSVTPIPDLLDQLMQHDVELRIMPSLWKLRESVIHSTLQFSIIRMRNALPPLEGMEAYYPL